MPIQSKYSSQKIETLLDEVMDVLHNNDASIDLSLMVLGNSITHIINTQVPASQRKAISDKFVNALSASIHQKEQK